MSEISRVIKSLQYASTNAREQIMINNLGIEDVTSFTYLSPGQTVMIVDDSFNYHARLKTELWFTIIRFHYHAIMQFGRVQIRRDSS